MTAATSTQTFSRETAPVLSPTTLDRLRRQQAFAARQQRKFKALTTREKEVLTMIAQGRTNGAIAKQMFRSVHTVRTHRNNIWRQLEITTVVEAVWWAECFDLI